MPVEAYARGVFISRGGMQIVLAASHRSLGPRDRAWPRGSGSRVSSLLSEEAEASVSPRPSPETPRERWRDAPVPVERRAVPVQEVILLHITQASTERGSLAVAAAADNHRSGGRAGASHPGGLRREPVERQCSLRLMCESQYPSRGVKAHAEGAGIPGEDAGSAAWQECAAKSAGSKVAQPGDMLKFLGAYAISKLLGFGLLGAIVIYLLIR